LKRKYAVLAAVLLAVLISLTLFLVVKPSYLQPLSKPFYVGVEFDYSNQFSALQALVDKVKDYTNLIVIGYYLPFNLTALNESCNYIVNAGLSFIVFFTTFSDYNSTGFSRSYTIFNWISDARQKYGDKFLGIYRFDEPGGNQLDNASSQLVNNTASFTYSDNSTGYAEVAQSFVGGLSEIIQYYGYVGGSPVFTSDYGLYWFDYESSYSTVFGEFVGNQSRQITIALDRGAAQSFNESWGVIITWKYDQPPYLENSTEMYNDLTLAYDAGAKYAVIFDYPNITASNFGVLTQSDFDALQRFWNNIHNNPGVFGSSPAEAAYVIPENYGFGFRGPTDTIWGLFPPGTLTQKIWDDTTTLVNRYGADFNIIYDDPQVIDATLNSYSQVFYWNQTVP
jgi:hypothetical protein